MHAYKIRLKIMYPDWGNEGKMEDKQREGVVLADNLKRAIIKTKQYVRNYSDITGIQVKHEILSIEFIGHVVTDDYGSFFGFTSDPIPLV